MIITAVIVFISIFLSGVSLMCMNRSGPDLLLNQHSQHNRLEEPESEGNERSSSSGSPSHSLTDSSTEQGMGNGCINLLDGGANRSHIVPICCNGGNVSVF